MKILAHRGAWNTPKEKNSIEAIEKAFACGWGVETDVRDYKGELVISHDIATDWSPKFMDMLNRYKAGKHPPFLAINVKADGIQELLMKELNAVNIKNFGVFDMSIPEQVVYRRMGIPFFARQSEIEVSPVMYEDAYGIWMDEWEQGWITADIINGHLARGKIVGVISPEIHGHDNQRLWDELRKVKSDRLMLCTDIPGKAEQVFYGD